MTTLFFYGLFMDRDRLVARGLHPEVIGPAVLPGYRIHVGRRATLVRSASDRAHGIVMALPDDEVRALYADATVREYVPESVQAERLDTGERVEADCYNLPADKGLVGSNPEYAAALRALAERLGFDDDYVRELAGFEDREEGG